MSQHLHVSRDPGLDGIVPFRFACHRCGNCCSGGSGIVRLEAGETSSLARALGMSEQAFVEHFVRRVVDPASGAYALALREDSGGDAGGRCVLLEGANICRAYDARPAQCREFPYWPRVLVERSAFEAARATCSGIAVVPSSELRKRAFARLAELHADVEAFLGDARRESSGECCLAGSRAHALFATALEADYAVAERARASGPMTSATCRLGRGRPLGCRLASADPECGKASVPAAPESASDACGHSASDACAHSASDGGGESAEEARDEAACEARGDSAGAARGETGDAEVIEGFYRRLRAIERELGYPSAYARLSELLRARGVRCDETEARA
jgi:Fe-S-cluster containining protein